MLIVSSVALGTLYAVVHQVVRQSADDPQVQIAQDTAHRLMIDSEYVLPAMYDRVDMDVDLAPFVIVFDDEAEVMSTTGYMDRRTPVPPLTVFEHAREDGEYRFTWEPAPQVRIAAVLVRYEGARDGYVLSGRSLRETDERLSTMLTIIVSAWIVVASILLFVALIQRPRNVA